MSDQDVAMRIAVASAFRDCGLPSLCVGSIAGHPPMAGGDRTAWLGM
jgi:hypothetical protein